MKNDITINNRKDLHERSWDVLNKGGDAGQQPLGSEKYLFQALQDLLTDISANDKDKEIYPLMAILLKGISIGSTGK